MDITEKIMKLVYDPSPEQVWAKAHFISAQHEKHGYRRDDYGNLMRFQDYGNRNSEYGWEKEHVIPASRGGSNAIANIRPLHWQANVKKSDCMSGLLGLGGIFAKTRGIL